MHELQVALRRLLRAPGFSVICVLTLAVGIGMVVAIFSLVHGIVLQQLPYPEPGRLVAISHDAPGLDLEDINASPPLYVRYSEVTTTFEELALVADGMITLTGAEVPDRLRLGRVTPTFFPLLRTAPQIGRGLQPGDAEEGAAPVAVISHSAWQQRFGGAEDVLQRDLELDGTARRVVGVMPAHFQFPDERTEVWLPLPMPTQPGALGAFGTSLLGRLAPGADLQSATTDLRRVTDDLEGYFPDEPAVPVLARSGLIPRLMPLHERMVGDLRTGLWVALGAVAMVLLLACANVANLFLVRAERRQQEIAVRSALGASRVTVASSFLLEGVLLALSGGALGVGIAHLGLRALRSFAPEGVPRLDSVSIDPPVLLFALVVALASAVAFSLLPALQSISSRFSSALKDGTRGAGWGRGRVQTRQILVAVQVALASMLLVGAGLLVRTFAELGAVDLGFDPGGVMTLQTSLSTSDYPSEDEVAALVDRLIPELEALPGVERAAVSSELPLSGRGTGAGHSLEDHPLAEDELPPVFRMKSVSEGYFEALRIPLLEGRGFEAADWQDRRGVAVVNQTLAKRWWPNGTAVGKRLRQGAPPEAEGEDWYEIVGVVGDTVDEDLRGEVLPQVFYPLRNRDGEGGLRGGFMLLARTGGEPSSLGGALRETIWSADRNVPITRMMTMEQLADEARAATAFSMSLLLLASVLALVLGALGVYGVLSFVVTLRTREIGLRLALGARRRGVRNQVLRSGVVLCSLGVAAGMLGALALTRLFASLLFRVSPLDPFTFVAVPLVLLAAAALASYVPARRAARVDPAIALRWE
ncbi:MAG: permease [Acidobacteria bacterium]|nr:MAG: permease [Acidobacteriota bacterium]REK08571.1 MAG: permease [Acidobacteriota bacterium]